MSIKALTIATLITGIMGAAMIGLVITVRAACAQSSMACGIAPIPPIGCRVGACVCDQYGHNCQWTFICR